jgi:hypothetical protein
MASISREETSEDLPMKWSIAHSTQSGWANEGTARRLLPLLAVLVLVLFPFEWLGVLYPSVGRLLDGVFSSELLHMAGHATLFAGLGLLVLRIFPTLCARPWRYFGLLLTGVGQECFQLLFKQRPLVFDDGRDLVVDAIGLGVAFAIVGITRKRRSEHRTEKEPEV